MSGHGHFGSLSKHGAIPHGSAGLRLLSGGGGIRTHETAQHRLAVFKTAPFDHSGTPPASQSSRRAADSTRLWP
jgi:hypothetical protein